MKKLFVTAVLFSMLVGAAALSCGSVCGDYEAKANDCCDKIAAGDKTAAGSCKAIVQQKVDADDVNACQKALDEVTKEPLCQ